MLREPKRFGILKTLATIKSICCVKNELPKKFSVYLYIHLTERQSHIPPFMYLIALWASDAVSYSTVIRWHTTRPDDFSAVTTSMQFIFPYTPKISAMWSLVTLLVRQLTNTFPDARLSVLNNNKQSNEQKTTQETNKNNNHNCSRFLLIHLFTTELIILWLQVKPVV